MPRRINEAGLDLIKSFEGLRLDAYQDVAGIWTIGYGHIRDVQEGMRFTLDEAEQALRDDLAEAEKAVERVTADFTTSDNHYAALVSLCFNVGSGNFRGSTVLKKHVEGDFDAAGTAFLMWNKSRVDGVLQEVGGLTRRRQAERDLYLMPSAPAPGSPAL
jgi:lysozyme